MGAALAGTVQASPGEDERTFRRIGDSVTAMPSHGFKPWQLGRCTALLRLRRRLDAG
ncbi:hypothetical protein [Streptomyces sp. NPDC086989]|uniref:hypothetical protein n=1 Tax=Streptomyces sp. NPDC086989 TaxID=3365764 RepID=UPI00380DFC0C